VSTDELQAGVGILHDFLDRFGRQSSDVVVSAKLQLFRPGASPQREPRASDLLGSADAVAAKIRAYHTAGLRYLIVDPSSHETPPEALAGC
jgi:alkanesulfonate monooxygenase SsuD/methylene tetrahydromethanopterin reductase-like flavin-dependent oxidoreductase (luciferase family)